MHPSKKYPLYKHQQATVEFMQREPRGFINNGMGSGKTRTVLEWYRQRSKPKGKMLVLAPLSILQPAWGDDIDKWTPDLSYQVAYAKNREQAFKTPCDIVITNHDAVKWLNKPENTALLADFDTLIIDEYTAVKNYTSQRSRAVACLRMQFPYRYVLSGTPTPNSITDIWHPALLVDDGDRLGHKFFAFRQQVCTPIQVGPDARMVKWVDKPGAAETVADTLSDITIRFATEDCVDLPEHRRRYVYTQLSPKVQKQYDSLTRDSLLIDEAGEAITGIHAGAKVKKLLQLCTGAVYNESGDVSVFHQDRYQLVVELAKECEHAVIGFNWRHERDQIIALLDKLPKDEKLTYAVIDGTVSDKDRLRAVRGFQKGDINLIIAHPQSAGHGLTLTRGERTIWCSPTYNCEHFEQFNRRIYRTGQSKKTETLMIAAKGTHEEKVYEALQGKVSRLEDLLRIFREDTKRKAA